MKRTTMEQTIARQKIVGVKHFQKSLFYHGSWLGFGAAALSSYHMIIKKETSFTTILLLYDSMIFEIYWNKYFNYTCENA